MTGWSSLLSMDTLGNAALGALAGYALGGEEGAIGGGLLGGGLGASGYGMDMSTAMDEGGLLNQLFAGNSGTGTLGTAGTALSGLSDIYSQYKQGQESKELLDLQKQMVGQGLLDAERERKRQALAEQNMQAGFTGSSNYYGV